MIKKLKYDALESSASPNCFYYQYVLICDNCGNKSREFNTWDLALEYKKVKAKSEGWTCKKYANGWADICPKCNS